jgi:DNA-directed RNA polymerase specialized sigma24 family protein
VRSTPRCSSGEPNAPYLRSCITGALLQHLRDQVRLVRISRQEREKGSCPLGHTSLDASADGEPFRLDQLTSPGPEMLCSDAADPMALEQLVDRLPARQATALWLTVIEGLSLRAAARQL